MKKNILYICITALFLLIIVSCENKSNPKKTDLEDMSLNGSVKSLRIIGYSVRDESRLTRGTKYEGRFEKFYLFNERGDLKETKEYTNDGDLNSKHLFFYDTNGLLINSEWFSEFGKEGVSEYIYDDKNQLIEAIHSNNQGKNSQRYTFKYDENGNQTELCWFANDSLLTLRSSKAFDKKGNKIADSSFSRSGILTDLSKYKYDDNGWLVESSYYELNKPIANKYFREVDENNNPVLFVTNRLNKEGEVVSSTSEKFRFDSHNNWIERILFVNETPELIEDRFIEYFIPN